MVNIPRAAWHLLHEGVVSILYTAQAHREGGAAVLFVIARKRKKVLKPLVCACLGLEQVY